MAADSTPIQPNIETDPLLSIRRTGQAPALRYDDRPAVGDSDTS